MSSGGDSDIYVSSEASSPLAVFHTPPQTSRKPRKMVMEVVIPVPNPAKGRPPPAAEEAQSITRRRMRAGARDPSPDHSDSSVSLGTHWHITPKKKRTRKPRKSRIRTEGEQVKSRIRPGRERKSQGAMTQTNLENPTSISQPDLIPPPPGEPVALDSELKPRFPSTSPFKPRSFPSSNTPGMRINLESARLETIQAQESARGYDTYDYMYWPTPPDSSSTNTRVTNTLNTPTMSSYSEPRTQLYAFSNAGSSIGPGTRERDRILEERNRSPRIPVSVPYSSRTSFKYLTPMSDNRTRTSFTELIEAELDTVDPAEANKLFRLGLQTALGKLVEQYGFPMDDVSKLYRTTGLSADPHHIAKRKRLIAEEFARDGTHAGIRKTISWGDIGKHGTDSPKKRPRTSLSQSITPGLSDMSTPTPVNRLRSSLKSSNSQKTTLVSSQNRPNTQSNKEFTGKPAPILQQPQPQFTSQVPSRGPSPQKPQTQPEVINLVSEETPRSNQNAQPLSNGTRKAEASNLPSRIERATESRQNVDAPVPTSPISEVGVQYQEQDIIDTDEPQSPGHVPLRASSSANATLNLAVDRPDSEAASKHLSSQRDSQPQRKRKTSNMGIQTIPDKDVDWLGDIGADDSMSAVEISRVWAEQRSGPKSSDEPDRYREPLSEPEEPLTGNFLDEVEDLLEDKGRMPQDLSNTEPLEATEDPNELNRQDQGQEFEEDIRVHAPLSRSPSPVRSLPSGQIVKPSAIIPASSPLHFPSSPPRETTNDDPQSSIRPYPFNLQGDRLAGTTDRLNTDTNAPQVDTQRHPLSLSQPNPFITGARARSRLYTPQPVPPARHRDSNQLRAAPTLGRSMLEATEPSTTSTNNSTHKPEITSKDLDSKVKILKAAPTLGRSTDWGHASPSRPVPADSNEKDGPSTGQQPTDYDAEYSSIPEAPSSFPLRAPSSPAHDWEVEPLHASTPHRLVTQMSPIAHDLIRDNALAKTAPPAENIPPTTLADFEKRRRSSIAPLTGSKKIRREYDTVESNAVPQLRAHRDAYDESGRRSWVPKRPAMKRALDVPPSSTKKSVGSSYPPPVEEGPEPAEERRGQVLSESALESRAETLEPVSYGKTMQEHQVEFGEQPWKTHLHETEDRAPHPPTEISETPQSTRVRDPYDLATSELRFESEQPRPVAPPKPTDFAYDQPTSSTTREYHSVNISQAEPLPPPMVGRVGPESQSASPQRIRLDRRSTKKAPSRPKRPSSGLQITPARQPVWTPPRTRLSMGGRSGISVIEVSKSDQDILVQAGLRPILKRLSQTHGFTVEVVAGVYQEAGSLKDTEDTLERMKHSAEKTRVNISRRRSTLGILSGEQREIAERDSSEVSETNNDYLNWDTSRMSSRILFGEGL
ncbi:unnamed protein product [Rhizoctonia solani]|uniref:Uncharacterized protein n=1 Tax=Rhizoctonia solani TaxID=456999 RepID=A0A8H2Y0Z4_9AGAM|nr:unnamed protein product [Rhizoctonia solani]